MPEEPELEPPELVLSGGGIIIQFAPAWVALIATVNNERKAQVLRIARMVLRKKKKKVEMSCLWSRDTIVWVV